MQQKGAYPLPTLSPVPIMTCSSSQPWQSYCCSPVFPPHQVQRWLDEVFGGEQILDYKINSHTVNVLYAMATRSERKASLAKIALEDIEEKIKEYSAESK